MPEFRFNAPTLYEPMATPRDELQAILHHAKGMADFLAKCEKFARWLATAMKQRGLKTKGPYPDESSWILETASKSGFVLCFVTGDADDKKSLFHILLTRYQGATDEVGHVVETILRQAPEITELAIKPD